MPSTRTTCGHEHGAERQREVAVGDRAAEGALGVGPLDVDVDPLVVAGGVGEQVHPLLGDLHVVAVAEVLSHELLEPGDPVDGRRHGADHARDARAREDASRMDGIVGVVLAAGRGTRLRPLTRLRPKALCPVGNVPLVDLALERVRPAVEAVAVNLHHGRRTLDLHLADDVHRSVEADAAPRHGRRARSPPAVDRRSGRARRQRRRLVPGLAGALRGRAGTASGSGCSSPAATSCGPTAPSPGR